MKVRPDWTVLGLRLMKLLAGAEPPRRSHNNMEPETATWSRRLLNNVTKQTLGMFQISFQSVSLICRAVFVGGDVIN